VPLRIHVSLVYITVSKNFMPV